MSTGTLPTLSGFASLCTRLGLFQPNPGPGYRLLRADDLIQPGDECIAGYAASGWRETGYSRLTVAKLQADEATFLPGHHQCFAFRRELP